MGCWRGGCFGCFGALVLVCFGFRLVLADGGACYELWVDVVGGAVRVRLCAR